ncbi:hypothetical protein [Limnobaculum xujianqingii]|uniref:hypothetical protein n=1 Tax=Limnobaculum xujianqingii TaxID=2738837 RepID=UPI00112CADF6|nr:hypothetical protein [Limnobaculum xujianqingii]
MLREIAKKEIINFISSYYSSSSIVKVICEPALGSVHYTDVKIIIKNIKSGFMGGDRIYQQKIQEFSNQNHSIISFVDFCQNVVNKYISDNKPDSTIKSLYGFAKADFPGAFYCSPKPESNLLTAADPYLELLKKATNEGRNNQLILSSVQLELLAAQAGANNFSKDDLIAALEKLATQYTEQANKSRKENI